MRILHLDVCIRCLNQNLTNRGASWILVGKISASEVLVRSLISSSALISWSISSEKRAITHCKVNSHINFKIFKFRHTLIELKICMWKPHVSGSINSIFHRNVELFECIHHLILVSQLFFSCFLCDSLENWLSLLSIFKCFLRIRSLSERLLLHQHKNTRKVH